MSVGHYENFPVASLLVPARYRGAVLAIYRFARAADDIADEGHDDKATRHRALDEFSRRLDAIERGETPGEAPFADLARAVREHALPIDLLRDLLSAFSQDVDVIRYATFADVLDYCRRSANPIGRLLLAMYRVGDGQALAESDAICTALQLANFWQDIAIDWRKNTRLYLPLEDIERFGVSFAQIAEGRCDAPFSRLMAFETARTRTMFDRGRPLVRRLPWRLGLELAAVVAGGMRVLERIDAVHGDVFSHRPVLGKRDWALLAFRMLAPSPSARAA
ncbi:MAG TPA: squalene synthase HpnC [Casimicrobiaceae bacterium]|nr:squalene synthase HpnC [Casimicrobiaceae bacterium]